MVEIEGINPLIPTAPLRRREERRQEAEQQSPEGDRDEHMPPRSEAGGDKQHIDEYV